MQGRSRSPGRVEHIASTSATSGARARYTNHAHNEFKPASTSDEDWRWHIDNWEETSSGARTSPPPGASSVHTSSAYTASGVSPFSKPAGYLHTAPKAFDPYARWDSWGAASMRRPAPSNSAAEPLLQSDGGTDSSKPIKAAFKRPPGTEKETWFSFFFSNSLVPTISAPATSDPVEQNEPLMLVILVLATLITRFYRLDVPPGICFDETHFGRFTNQYTAGTYLFDIHPPLGKLVFWAVGWLVGFDHTACKFVNIGEQYGPNCKFMALRITSALFGCFTVPLMYGIARQWGISVRGALLAGLLLNFDGLNTIEGRLILMDSQLMFWCAASLFAAQLWWKRLNGHAAAEETFLSKHGKVFNVMDTAHRNTSSAFMSLTEKYLWLVGMGILCANAVSVKWTGLATPGLIAIESFFGFFFLKKPVKFVDGCVIVLVAFLTYAWYFYCHFALLPLSGDGDGFMRLEFQRTLKNNPNYDPNASSPLFWKSFIQLNQEMLSANARITQRHHWDSVWYEWPLNLRGVLYYSKDLGHTYTATVYLLGNPLVLWIVAASMCVAVLTMGVYCRSRRFSSLPEHAAFERWTPAFTVLIYCMLGYACNMLPYALVTRSCFLYHYMPALMYGQLLTAALVDMLAGRKWMPRVTRILISIVCICYVFYAPWIYAIPLTSEGHQRRRWYHRWD